MLSTSFPAHPHSLPEHLLLQQREASGVEVSGLVQVINGVHSEEIMPFVGLALFNHRGKALGGERHSEGSEDIKR